MAWELIADELPLVPEGRDRSALLTAKRAGPPPSTKLPAALDRSLGRHDEALVDQRRF